MYYRCSWIAIPGVEGVVSIVLHLSYVGAHGLEEVYSSSPMLVHMPSVEGVVRQSYVCTSAGNV